MSKNAKPILNSQEQIDHLINKGVVFDLISTEEAKLYLDKNNNYFKLRAYRKNFPKHPDGSNKDKYINLDFAMLKDLAIIDMRLRYVLLHMALDIEHFSKVKLLKEIEASDEDGYEIVEDYCNSLKSLETDTYHPYKRLVSELSRNADNPYCGGIIKSYGPEYPIWAFIEIIPFGEYINFYKFCANRLFNTDLENDFHLFMAIKSLRNACAHNNCIINELYDKNARTLDYGISRILGKNGVTKSEKESKVCNERIRQIVTLLYTHYKIVNSDGVRSHEREELKSFVDRAYKNIEYYERNPKIKTTFNFLKKCIDIFMNLSV